MGNDLLYACCVSWEDVVLSTRRSQRQDAQLPLGVGAVTMEKRKQWVAPHELHSKGISFWSY